MPSPPEWLQELADAAALQLIPADVLSPIGCHFGFADEAWEISLFAASTQIVGGKHDGVLRPSRFHFLRFTTLRGRRCRSPRMTNSVHTSRSRASIANTRSACEFLPALPDNSPSAAVPSSMKTPGRKRGNPGPRECSHLAERDIYNVVSGPTVEVVSCRSG
jgi:hypothetical protein